MSIHTKYIKKEPAEQETQKGESTLSLPLEPWDGTLHRGSPMHGHPWDVYQHRPSGAVSS